VRSFSSRTSRRKSSNRSSPTQSRWLAEKRYELIVDVVYSHAAGRQALSRFIFEFSRFVSEVLLFSADYFYRFRHESLKYTADLFRVASVELYATFDGGVVHWLVTEDRGDGTLYSLPS